MGNRNFLSLVDGKIRAHDPKTYGLPSTPFIEELKGISPFDRWKRVKQFPTQLKPYNIMPRLS